MLDEFRERPHEALSGIIQRRREKQPSWQPPVSVRLLEWMFLTTRRGGTGLGRSRFECWGRSAEDDLHRRENDRRGCVSLVSRHLAADTDVNFQR